MFGLWIGFCRYLARSPTINFYPINTDSFWIHAPYRIWKLNVKSKSKKWGFEYQNLKIQIARFTPFCWDIICKSQGFNVLKFLFLSELIRFIVWGYTFTLSAIFLSQLFTDLYQIRQTPTPEISWSIQLENYYKHKVSLFFSHINYIEGITQTLLQRNLMAPSKNIFDSLVAYIPDFTLHYLHQPLMDNQGGT